MTRRETTRWMVQHHPVFQLHYFSYLSQEERDRRDRWRDHDLYAITAQFCEKYDQASFDPDYPTERIEVFEPMVVGCSPRPDTSGWV